ncbi:sugar transporter SWEET1 isoform X1 [Meriones unguiculatus]|uniref:sugar transporter SWEET1 isoform X1 n=1 Tax=Meriones unguiculatus TaxID=10047 RepID=UPI00293E812E|nr:sugar transporter SWEET1 isoform X1 [Meriones unguiculatus]
MEAGGAADSFLSSACVLFTLGMFSTGLSDLRHMQTTRSVDSIQFLPFLTTDVNNLGWLSYGVLKGDVTLIIVNAVGAVLQTLYILAYLHYSPQKHAALLQTGTLLSVLLLGYGYFWLLVPDLEARLQQLGIFCSVFTISMPRSFRLNQPSVSPSHSPSPPSFPLPPGPSMGFDSETHTSWCPTFQGSLPASSALGFSASTPQSMTGNTAFYKHDHRHLSASLIPNRAPVSAGLRDQFHGRNRL